MEKCFKNLLKEKDNKMKPSDIRNIINILESFDNETNLLNQIVKEYRVDELFTFEDVISEDMENLQPIKNEIWDVDYSNAFKKGLKKHSNNPRVTEELKQLESFILSNNRKAAIETYPPQFNVHVIKRDPKFAGSYSAHVMGKKIITLFYVENGKPNTLRWIFVGTHQEANPNW
jgi:mRNA-degrading endonuclease YafQ of YafQ-DinJ toxin-antitoxin module